MSAHARRHTPPSGRALGRSALPWAAAAALCVAGAGPGLAAPSADSAGHAAPSAAAAPASVRLPIRRVVLYSSGIAFMERRGHVSGSVEVRLPLRASQVDDALKSLFVLDLGHGRIGEVRYDSPAPPMPSQGSFEIPAVTEDSSGPAGLGAVLQQLQGARVHVEDGMRSATGEVLTVERQLQHSDGKPDERDAKAQWRSFVVLAGEQGELHRFDLAHIRGLRILDPDVRRGLRGFSHESSAARRAGDKTITIRARGGRDRELVVSYTTAAPVWKMTYRAALSAAGAPFLQGWAIVDNAGEEDWRDVELSLVSGSPVSFVQHLQQPLFRYRPVLDLPRDLSVRPQEIGPLATRGPWDEGPAVAADFGGVGGGAAELGGVVTGTIAPQVMVPPHPDRIPVESDRPETTLSDLLTAAGAGVEARARPVTRGDLFDYRVEAPISIARDQSALVPIVQARVEGERVALWRDGVRSDGRPLAALRLRNTTRLVLEGGSITILDGDALAGEAALGRLKPGEEQLVTYAVDLDTLVASGTQEGRKPAFLVRACEGAFEAHYHRTRTTTWTLTNQADHARIVYLEQRREANWELSEDGPRPVDPHAPTWRFRMELAPKSRTELPITEQLAMLDRYALGSLSQANLQRFEKEGLLDAETRTALERIFDLRTRVKSLEERSAAAEREAGLLVADQARLRENVRATSSERGARELVRRWLERAGTQETRLQALQADRSGLEAEIASTKAALARAIQNVSIERRL